MTELWRLKAGLLLLPVNTLEKMEWLLLLHVYEKSCFTVVALNNLDHNPSSTTSQVHSMGLELAFFNCRPRWKLVLTDLPLRYHLLEMQNTRYAFVPAVALKTTAVAVPECIVYLKLRAA
ncbi:hypothetical protein Pcinc_039695 [Petrolisthes cinctipes]|uniref:Uncharacterized protein n=1 Tax=Petrolisthes cinctipes TaxID=88211 RepID=A0AAE1EKB1_PETCI|nr:hypothetical protein Pcinc_039695 [Petrolisthes cinctipes]